MVVLQAQTTVLEGDSISCTFNVVDPAFCEEPTGEVEIFPVAVLRHILLYGQQLLFRLHLLHLIYQVVVFL